MQGFQRTRSIKYFIEFGCSRSNVGYCFSVETSGALDELKSSVSMKSLILQLYAYIYVCSNTDKR